jgi:hypothetical protein
LVPGKKISLHLGTLGMLATGAVPYIHMGRRPTGKAHTEAAIRRFKARLLRMVIRRALREKLAGRGMKQAYVFESEEQYARFFDEALHEFNQQIHSRTQMPRERLYLEHPESVQMRHKQRLAEDWEVRLGGIAADAHVARVGGRYLTARLDDKAVEVEIQDAPQLEKASVALCLRAGMLAEDDPAQWRVMIVAPGTNRPLLIPAVAYRVKTSVLGYPVDASALGEYRAVPSTAADRLKQDIERDVKQRHVAVALAGKRLGEGRAAQIKFSMPPTEEDKKAAAWEQMTGTA